MKKSSALAKRGKAMKQEVVNEDQDAPAFAPAPAPAEAVTDLELMGNQMEAPFGLSYDRADMWLSSEDSFSQSYGI